MIGLLDIAGSSVAVEPSGWWWAACPPGEWPADPAERRRIENSWDIDFGDRMNELVIVGYGLNEANVQRALDACLVGELETTNPDGADDPFGEWDDGLDDGIRMPDHDGPPWPVMFN